jgi:Na+/H+-translocating membrane pyrophosphatase
MMATTAMQLAIDAFGPIADNAGGIAEMSQLPPEVRERTDNLDAVGNTTAATGKGFAIASAALTSLALFAAFVGVAGIDAIDIYKAPVLAALFVGGMIPYKFGSSDGLFNLGSALAFVQTLPAGVYIAMNGRYFVHDNCRKNKETGVFETLR